jgi:transposase
MITDLTLRGFGEAFIVDGSANGDLFEVYVEQILAPSLSSGEIVILDNCSIHMGKKVQQLIEARSCQLLFLPAYSPDLTPIEEAFSKVKAILRGMGPHTRETLQQALELLLLTLLDGSDTVAISYLSLPSKRLLKYSSMKMDQSSCEPL